MPLAALCISLVLSYPQSPESLGTVAAQLIDAGYKQDDAALETGIGQLSAYDASSPQLTDYWRGYAFWRRAQGEAQGSGLRVEEFVDASVCALERAVRAKPNFADAHALLSGMYDYQMQFHHENKGRWSQMAEAAMARAKELDPENPRVLFAIGVEKLFAPAQYGGSVPLALETFAKARIAFAAESKGGRSLPDPIWGSVDLEVFSGDAHLALKDPSAARACFEAALEQEANCVEARLRGLPACRRLEAVLEGEQLAAAPLPIPKLLADPAIAGWPQWRGPSRDGVATESEWNPEGFEVWRRELGLGYSGLVVAEGRLFSKGYDQETGLDCVIALNAETGEELWRHEYPAAIWNEMHEGGTLSAPTVDGDHVYVLNREGKLHCFAAQDGKVIWQRDLVDAEGLQVARWGFAAAPVVLGEQLILNVGRVLSLNKNDGKRQWRTRHYGDAYSTPTPFVRDGQPRLAAFLAEGLVVVDLQTGAEQAFFPWRTTYDQNCASPLLVGDQIFISSGMNRGCAMLDFDGRNLQEAWGSKNMRNTMTACVSKDGALYGFDNRMLKCLDSNGEEMWRVRGLGWGALSIAGDYLVFLSEDGELTIAEANAEEFLPLANAKVFTEGKCWSSPVLVNGLLYLRSNKGELVCRDHRL